MMTSLTDEEIAEIHEAVDRINSLFAKIGAYDRVKIRPWVRFNDDTGFAALQVEVTTGRYIFE